MYESIQHVSIFLQNLGDSTRSTVFLTFQFSRRFLDGWLTDPQVTRPGRTLARHQVSPPPGSKGPAVAVSGVLPECLPRKLSAIMLAVFETAGGL